MVSFKRMNNEISYRIRPAIISDATVMAQININSWKSTYAGLIAQTFLDAMNNEHYVTKWQNILDVRNDVHRCVFVAEVENTVVGYVTAGRAIKEHSEYPAELSALYLLSEFHGLGIGKALFLSAVRELDHRGYESFALYVLKDNVIGRSFYDRYSPDEIIDKQITIEGAVYCDLLYGWYSIKNVLQLHTSP